MKDLIQVCKNSSTSPQEWMAGSVSTFLFVRESGLGYHRCTLCQEEQGRFGDFREIRRRKVKLLEHFKGNSVSFVSLFAHRFIISSAPLFLSPVQLAFSPVSSHYCFSFFLLYFPDGVSNVSKDFLNSFCILKHLY